MRTLVLSLVVAGAVATAGTGGTAAETPAAKGAASLASGQASGSLTVGGKTVALAHAAAFVDAENKAKPVLLLLTDQAVPVAGFKSHGDLMPYHMDHRFNGVVLTLDPSGKLVGAEYWVGSFPASTTGYFVVEMQGAPGKSLAGSAHSTPAAAAASEPVSLKVSFKADLK